MPASQTVGEVRGDLSTVAQTPFLSDSEVRALSVSQLPLSQVQEQLLKAVGTIVYLFYLDVQLC